MTLPSNDEDEADVKATPQENNEEDDSGVVDGAEEDEEEDGRSGNRGDVEEGENDDDNGNDNDNDDNEVEEDKDVDTSKEESTALQPPKPVKRARLAYSIFCDEKRPEMQTENPEMETEEIAAKLNKLWRELSEDDQLEYREKAAVEHDEVAQKQLNYEAELKTWKEAGGVLEDRVESSTNAPPKAPLKPVKRAATAYFLFSSEKRPQLRTENPGASVAVIAKELGKLWNALSEEEKRPYNEKAAEERERVAQELVVWEKEFQQYEAELAAWKVAGGTLEEQAGIATYSSNLIFPVARIKKIAKLDPEVGGISKDALLLITKCAELATSKLGTEAVRVAKAQNRRKLLPEDVAHVCTSREQFIFLKDDIKDLLREMLPTKSDQNDVGNAAAHHRAAANSEAAAGSKRLASYFGENATAEEIEHSGAGARTSKKDKKDDTRAAVNKNVEAAKGSKPLTSYFGTTNKA